MKRIHRTWQTVERVGYTVRLVLDYDYVATVLISGFRSQGYSDVLFHFDYPYCLTCSASPRRIRALQRRQATRKGAPRR